MREYGFLLTRILPYKDMILSLYGRIRVSENRYSTIFYAVIDTKGKPFLAMYDPQNIFWFLNNHLVVVIFFIRA